MTASQQSRRRFLVYLAALGGAGLLGGIAWAERRAPSPEVEAGVRTATTTTTGAPSTTTGPPAATTSSPPATTAAPPATTLPSPIVIEAVCPEAWSALPVIGKFETHTIERLTVHHTAVVLEDNRQAPARARQHQQYHQELGWPDLAYHFLIDAGGNVYRGRPVTAVGDTATEYDPTGHFLVCCEGHFDQQVVSQAQLASLVDVLAWAALEFDVSPETISGHRDWASTTCPGEDLHGYLASGYLRDAVVERLSAGGAQMEEVCGSAGTARVAAIESGPS